MKSLTNIMEDMSRLYDEVDVGTTELKKASELANIAGKYLKAHQLDFAREVFLKQAGQSPRLPPPEAPELPAH